MALRTYICQYCKRRADVFDGEEANRLWPQAIGCRGAITFFCEWVKAPLSPMIVHTTQTFMADSQLDCLHTMYELDRMLNIEAAEDREMKALNKTRPNL